jgi:spore germination cell wall hydrolase CwlJ-like protein
MRHEGLSKMPDRNRFADIVGTAVDAISVILLSLWLIGGLGNLSLLPARGQPARHLATREAALVTASANLAASQVPLSTFEPVTPEQAQLLNANVPISTLPNPPADPFRLITANPIDRTAALTCLTMAVYYEAGNQGDPGEAAVAQVVLNRLRNPLFPKSVCGVVFEGSTLSTGCQFTFTCDGSLNRRPSQFGWKKAGQVAERALDGHVQPLVGEATHYHTIWVVPYWQSSLIKVTQIGAHIFYRWPGPLGMPVSFRGQYEGLERVPPLTPTIDGAPLPTDPIGAAAIQTPDPPLAPPPPEAVQVAKAVTPVGTPPLQVAGLAPPVAQIKIQPAQKSLALTDEHRSNPHLPIPANW